MSLKFAALGTLTILSALGTSTRADEKGQESRFPDADQGRAEHSETANRNPPSGVSNTTTLGATTIQVA